MIAGEPAAHLPDGDGESSPPGYIEWRERVSELAGLLYGHALAGLEEELLAGYVAGDSPAECLAGMFSPE